MVNLNRMPEFLIALPLPLLVSIIVIFVAIATILLIIAIKQGREVSLWPPKIGPRIRTSHEEQQGADALTILTKASDLQDPQKPVEKERLSWLDVSCGLEKFLKEMKDFKPEVIFGINRGGAILGGLIAKKLHIQQVFILDVDQKRPTEQMVIEHRQPQTPLSGNVLLVDDARRTGESMKVASDYLLTCYKDIDLRRGVLLRIDITRVGLGSRSPTPIDYYSFHTSNGNVKLPWDS